MRASTGFVAFCLSAFVATSSCENKERADVRAKPLIDHHAHILSPHLIDDWKKVGAQFSKPDASYGALPSGAGAVSSFGNFRIKTGGAVSMAHIYGAEWFRGALKYDQADELSRVQRENDFAAQAAGDAPFFCSAPFARPYTSEEALRCAETLEAYGLKIHLGAAEADFKVPAQLSALSELFALAVRFDMTVLLHLDPQRRGTDVEDVVELLNKAVGPHPNLRLVIAHFGGSGGYGPWPRSVFTAINDWLQQEEEAGRPRPGIYFDISAVLMAEETEGVSATSPEEIEHLKADLRRFGFERILFASDYPVFDPLGYAGLLADQLALTNSEADFLIGNHIK